MENNQNLENNYDQSMLEVDPATGRGVIQKMNEDQKEQKPKPMVINHPVAFEVTDNKIPHRNNTWYIGFAIVYIIFVIFSIYRSDWTLLFFSTAFAGVILWRGHSGKKVILSIDDKGILLNDRNVLYEQIDKYRFSKIGDDTIITFKMDKKYYPKQTFILQNNNDSEAIKKLFAGRIDNLEDSEESLIDLVIRKMRL